ncbi:hypothetical protein EUTSA_v10019140mg [Eutrema salsugineum]|uniref:Uncharacterized protein n=1 Tax=Eutrema salsugineum TaxID=72664 RepID=V4M7K6_EUTSA|nr:uncharacterized protein LOC18008392 [Eutrema salsugineum]ESQ27101.1 hypothetical protein EUTSA_v10019140mg [Eutrema salsugineum]
MSGENWIRAAMSDDSLVAEALLRLRHSEPPPPQKTSDASPLKLKWSVRQRRSKKGDQTRASPTTPLSWSGATSISGGGGGATTVECLEESSAAVKQSETFRSTISQTSAVTTTTTLFKRSRKKKTLAELKEEENMLLIERKGLKIELASIRDMVEQQRKRNNALKKIKAESQSVLSCKRAFEQGSSFLLPDLNMPLDTDTSPEVVC